MKTKIENLTDLLKQFEATTPRTLGRNFYKYTDCGPWTRFIIKDESDRREHIAECESEEMKTPQAIIDCIAIQIGSIVEGSDVEIGPVRIEFPTDNEAVSRVIEEINDEADYYWKRDNLEHN